MADISTVLKTTYAKEMQLIAQQLTPRVVSRTRVISNVGGVAYRPELLDLNATETQGAPARGADHSNLDVNHREVIISLIPQFSPTYLQKHEFLAFSGSAGLRKNYAMNQLANINRWLDDRVIAAVSALNTPLAAAASSDALGAGNFTYTKFLTALEKFDSNEYSDYNKVTCLISSAGVRDLRTFIEVKSNDFDKINSIMMGMPTELWGITFVLTNRLPLGTGIIDVTKTTRKMYMFSSLAVESPFVAGSSPETTLAWIEEKSQFLVNAAVYGFGSGVTFVGGVVEIENEELAI